MKWPVETPAVVSIAIAGGVGISLVNGIPWYLGLAGGLIISALVLGLRNLVGPRTNGKGDEEL